METAELLKKVRKIEIKSRGLSNQIFSGEYHSAFKGRGMSFSEVREYQYGDEIKAIDWNVTARLGTPYVKVFEEERELTVMLLVDVSGSSFFGSQQQMKNELMTEISAVLAFSAINNNDKVGVIFFSNRIELFIPPKKGKSHVLRLIRELLAMNSQPNEDTTPISPAKAVPLWKRILPAKTTTPTPPPTDIALALRYLSNVIKRRSIAFVLSDFISTPYEKALSLASKKHDIVGIHLHDQAEDHLPSVGMLYATDSETGKSQWIDTANTQTIKNYQSFFAQNFSHCKQIFSRSGADLISVSTNRPYIQHLMNFFKKRGA